eukprot:15441328-Alexandrium_andersonii.AAC.2
MSAARRHSQVSAGVSESAPSIGGAPNANSRSRGKAPEPHQPHGARRATTPTSANRTNLLTGQSCWKGDEERVGRASEERRRGWRGLEGETHRAHSTAREGTARAYLANISTLDEPDPHLHVSVHSAFGLPWCLPSLRACAFSPRWPSAAQNTACCFGQTCPPPPSTATHNAS